MSRGCTIVTADSPERIECVRRLFQEYAEEIAVDLCFQNFESELASLPGDYAPPSGELFLAETGQQIIGCVGVKSLDREICEMKRLYVQPLWRGQGVGRCLAEQALHWARQQGYVLMRLDTLPAMQKARKIYNTLGFYTIEPYYANEGCTQCMELRIGGGKT